jgi:hypothetical protein
MTLLAQVLAYRYAGESDAACIARIASQDTHAAYQEATLYVASIKPQYRESNPKIDIYRDGTERADHRYVGSTNWHRTCRDALIHKMLAEPGVQFKAVRGK